jgi:hypothetical protein
MSPTTGFPLAVIALVDGMEFSDRAMMIMKVAFNLALA